MSRFWCSSSHTLSPGRLPRGRDHQETSTENRRRWTKTSGSYFFQGLQFFLQLLTLLLHGQEVVCDRLAWLQPLLEAVVHPTPEPVGGGRHDATVWCTVPHVLGPSQVALIPQSHGPGDTQTPIPGSKKPLTSGSNCMLMSSCVNRLLLGRANSWICIYGTESEGL